LALFCRANRAGQCRLHLLALSFTGFDPGCVKRWKQSSRRNKRIAPAPWQFFHSRTPSCLYQSSAETTR